VTSASFYMRSARAKRTGAVATRVSRARKKGRHLFRSVDGDGQELNDASNTAMKSFDDEFTSDHVVEDGIANKFDGGKIETMVQTGDDKKVGGKQVLVFTILSAGFLTILFLATSRSTIVSPDPALFVLQRQLPRVAHAGPRWRLR